MKTASNITSDRTGSAMPVRFVNAWSRELAGIVWQLVLPVRRRRTLLLKSSNKIEVFSKHNKELGVVEVDRDLPRALADVSSILRNAGVSRQKLVVKLAQDQVLSKQLVFPQEARDVLEPVVRNQLQQLVPWPADETIFGFRVIEHIGDKISVSVAAVHRDQLHSLQHSAAAAQIGLTRVESSGLGENSPGIALFDEASQRQDKLASYIRRALAVVALASTLVGAVGAYQWYASTQASSALANEIRRLQAELESRSAQHDAREGVAGEVSLLVGAKTKSEMSLAILDELTRTLPDQAFLSSVTLKDGRLAISGKADDAAALIAALEGSKFFRSVRFSGPTVRASHRGKEDFAIEAKVDMPAAARTLWQKQSN